MANAIFCSASNFSHFLLRDLSKDKVVKDMKPFRNSLIFQCLTFQFQRGNWKEKGGGGRKMAMAIWQHGDFLQLSIPMLNLPYFSPQVFIILLLLNSKPSRRSLFSVPRPQHCCLGWRTPLSSLYCHQENAGAGCFLATK